MAGRSRSTSSPGGARARVARRAAGSAAVAAIFAVAGCGGKVLIEGDAEGAGEPLPPLPTSCAAAIDAIDWEDCLLAAGPDLRRTAAIVCAHNVATKGCGSVADAYWGCLAAHAPACVVTSTEPPGSVGTSVPAAACDGVLDALATCLAGCRTAYACEQEDWRDCRCDDAAANAGAECVAYPTLSSSLPDCNVLCSSCEPERKGRRLEQRTTGKGPPSGGTNGS